MSETKPVKKVTVAVSFDTDLWDQLNAQRHDMRIDSKGEFIRRMVLEGIKRVNGE